MIREQTRERGHHSILIGAVTGEDRTRSSRESKGKSHLALRMLLFVYNLSSFMFAPVSTQDEVFRHTPRLQSSHRLLVAPTSSAARRWSA